MCVQEALYISKVKFVPLEGFLTYKYNKDKTKQNKKKSKTQRKHIQNSRQEEIK